MGEIDYITEHEGAFFCDGCGEQMSTEEIDFGCAACGGHGFDDDGQPDEADEWGDYDRDC